MTDAEFDQAVSRSVERIKAERETAGRPPFIENPAVYRLLDACLAARASDPDRK